MNKRQNPLQKLAGVISKLQTMQEAAPEDMQSSQVKYSGKFEDYYGEPITIEVLYDDDISLGNATIRHGHRVINIKFKTGGAGVIDYRLTKGSELDLVEVVLALATDMQPL